MRTQNPSSSTKVLLASLFAWLLLNPQAYSADLTPQESSVQYIPKAVAISLEKSQIPKEAISISVVEIEPGRAGKITAKTEVDWRSKQAMNPASTMKLITTLTGLDVLGPQYRWRTNDQGRSGCGARGRFASFDCKPHNSSATGPTMNSNDSPQ